MKLLKNWIFWALVVSIGGVVAGHVFLYPVQFDLCAADFATLTFDNACLSGSSLTGTKLFHPSLALTLVFLLLLFVPHAVRAWRKFAIWFIPVVGFLIATAPPETPSGGFGLSGNIGPSFQEQVMWFSVLYVIGSLVAIVGSWYKVKTKKSIPWYFSATAVVLTVFGLSVFSFIALLYLTSK